MVYHSSMPADGCAVVCSCALLPLRTATRGPAELTQGVDIIDEAISFYRANVLFRNYDVLGPSDRTLIYLELVIGLFLKRFEGCKTKRDGYKMVNTVALEPFHLPGDAQFALGGFLTPAANRADADSWRAYMKQAREETGLRLLEKCYTPEGGLNKFWMAFSNRKFLNKAL